MEAFHEQLLPRGQIPNFPAQHRQRMMNIHPPRSAPAEIVESVEVGLGDVHMGTEIWSSPVTPITRRPRPATIHEPGFDFLRANDFQALPAWDSPSTPMSMMQSMQESFKGHLYQTRADAFPIPATQEWWSYPSYEMASMASDVPIGQAFTADEAIPMADLPLQPASGLHFGFADAEHLFDSKRMSGSSFTLSTSGGVSDIPSFDDLGAALSEDPSDFPIRSNRNSLMSSTARSPVASPCTTPHHHQSNLGRTQSRGRASPSPRPSMRSAPYSLDGRSNSKRWSTGSFAPTGGSRRPSPFVYQQSPDTFPQVPLHDGTAHHSQAISGTSTPLNASNLQSYQGPFTAFNNQAASHRNSIILPSKNVCDIPHQPYLETPPTLLSHGMFRMLSSNSDAHALHSQCVDLCDPPDLFASLQEEPLEPPEADMTPADPTMEPHEQELRFDGDLYTPKWVRGHGNKREGWCGICRPGRWLVLKNSAFWYDKSFTHGISAATGSAFHEPLDTRRMEGNLDIWEGLCGSCHEWVPLVSSKKKGTTWFRHAYKCHTHLKIKDAPKRRRESSHARSSLVAATAMMTPRNQFIKMEGGNGNALEKGTLEPTL